MSLFNYNKGRNDHWFVTEKLMTEGIVIAGLKINIKPSDYDLTKPQSILAWNKAWANYYTLRMRQGYSNHATLTVAAEMRKANPRITHISHGVNGGVKTRCSPFPELDEIPSLMDWLFCENVSREEQRRRISTTYWKQTKLYGVDGGSREINCGTRAVLNLVNEGLSRVEIEKRLKGRIIYASHSAAHRTNDNKTHLFKNQIEIDHTTPIPDYNYIESYVRLNVNNYLSLRKQHGKTTDTLLHSTKRLDEWLDDEWVENYINDRRTEWLSRVKQDKLKEMAARKAIEEAEIIVNEFEGMMQGVVE